MTMMMVMMMMLTGKKLWNRFFRIEMAVILMSKWAKMNPTRRTLLLAMKSQTA